MSRKIVVLPFPGRESTYSADEGADDSPAPGVGIRQPSGFTFSTIRRLNAQSDSATINRAILQFFKSYDDVLQKTGLLAAFKQDGTMFADGRNFVWTFMLNQLSRSKLREIQAALSSENAADLYELLIQGNKNWFRDIEFDGKAAPVLLQGRWHPCSPADSSWTSSTTTATMCRTSIRSRRLTIRGRSPGSTTTSQTSRR